MTFNKLVWKMVRYHYKKYIFYLVCNIIAVTFLFMFTSIFFNDFLGVMKESGRIQHELTIPAAALIIFTVFFIIYAHQLFMKRRSSEFGLFMTLGMTTRDIVKLIVLENVAIAFLALMTGIGLGMISSKIFFSLLLNFLNIQDIFYHLNANMFIYSITPFLIVFMIGLGQSLYITVTRKVVDHLKSDQLTENSSSKNVGIGLIGVLFIFGSMIGLYVMAVGVIAEGYFFLWPMMTFLGLYITLYQFTSFIINFLKRNKTFYYRRLLFLTNLDYKYKQLTSIILLATVLIMVTLLYSTIVASEYTLTEKNAIENNPFDVGYIQTETKNNVPLNEVYAVFQERGNSVQEHYSVTMFSYVQENYYGKETYSLMSVQDFNEVTSNNFTLREDEFLYLVNEANSMEMNVSTPYEAGFHLQSNGDEVVYDIKEVVMERQFNGLTVLSEVFVFNHTELERIKGNTSGIDLTANFINITEWKESNRAVNHLEQMFEKYNSKTPTIELGDVVMEEEFTQMASRVNEYNMAKNSNGVVVFVTIFFSILFFIGAFGLLYVQLSSNIEKEVERIKQLRRIGITSKELRKLLVQEVTTIFVIPMLLGTTLALLYIVLMTAKAGDLFPYPELILNYILIAGVYCLIHFIFLVYAREKMFRQLTN